MQHIYTLLWAYVVLIANSLEGFSSVNHVVEFSISKTFQPQKGLLQLQKGYKNGTG